jgi:regulator of sigma E protease
LPRVQIDGFADPDSPVAQKLQVGDVVVAGLVTGKTDRLNNPSSEAFRNFVDAAGKAEQTVDLTVLRDGELVEANALPLKELVNDRFGLGVTIREDSTAPLVAAVAPDSPAAALGVRPGTTVTAINGTAVADWYEIDQAFKRLTDGDELAIEFDDGTTTTLALTAATADRLGRNLYDTRAAQFMQRRLDTRQADNVVQALWWGVEETRYLILKFYLTLRRIATGDVPPSLLNGPVGIIDVGTRIATTQNTDYMIWFLAMISANLAVVNFLPLPIVDGGLFCFLLYEAVRGKPPSPKVQYYTQIVGLLLIGSIFLFVTFNDLGRLGLF